jgi:hypothetical protein
MGSDRGALREIHNPTLFAKHVTDFIARSINASEDLPVGWVKLPLLVEEEPSVADPEEEVPVIVSIRDQRFVMAITALRILVRVDGLIDDVICETSTSVPSILLSLLELPQDSEVSHIGSKMQALYAPGDMLAVFLTISFPFQGF